MDPLEGEDVFTTKLGIGHFIVLVTLVTELLVMPLFEFLKNRLTNAIAINKVANSQQIILRSDKWLSHWLGVSDNVKNDSKRLRSAYVLKILFKGLIIGMLAYWESSANEVTVAKVSLQPLAVGRDLSGTRLMSPMPFTGLSENEIIKMVIFSPNGVEQEGSYAVLDGEDYTFSGDEECTKLTDGKLTIYLSRVEISEKNVRRICLDGTDMKPEAKAAELNVQTKNQTSYNLNTIALKSEVATDGLSTIYDVSASYNDEDKEGYAALTRNSHQNGNTRWSLYGVLYNRDGSNFEYLNIPITGLDAKPCEATLLGDWRFSEEAVTCPDGTNIVLPTGFNGNHVVDGSWVLPSSKFLMKAVDPSELALQWVAETPFSEYVAKTKLGEEIWSRMKRQVYFVSDFQQAIELPEARTMQHVQTSRKRVIITTASLVAVLLILLAFFIVEKWQRRRHNIKMDFCDIGSVLGMWNSEISDKPTCADSSTAVTVGLTQSEDSGPQHVGTLLKAGELTRSGDDTTLETGKLDKVEMAKRDPKLPLE